MSAAPENVKAKTETETNNAKGRNFLKFEKFIYIWAITGSISQVLIVVVIIGHLITGLDVNPPELEKNCVVYSALAMAALAGSAFSEILLMRAVNQRLLRYIQWWMTSTLIILIFSILMTVISGFTLSDQALYITLAFCYLVIRLPFQIYFVDKFAHKELVYTEPRTKEDVDAGVLYRRFV